MSRIGILGAGTWGAALARMLCVSGHEVTMWSALPQEIEQLKKTHVHPNLPGMVLPEGVALTTGLAEACEGRDVVLFAVPSVFVRSTAEKAKPLIGDQIIVDVAKGIEPGTLLTMSGILHEVLGESVPVVALTGPTHAEEVAVDMPTAIVSASEDMDAAQKVQDIFMNTCMRVYTNPDVRGCEICGAMKNIIALAAGCLKGLGLGDNPKAALMTRGMAEITRLGMAMGCMPQTFYGLAGIGDLIVTATSEHSRNNRCGELIGRGVPPREAVKQVGMVVEGVNALPAVMELSELKKVELPICTAVNDVVNGGLSAGEAIARLMNRDKRSEVDWMLPEGAEVTSVRAE